MERIRMRPQVEGTNVEGCPGGRSPRSVAPLDNSAGADMPTASARKTISYHHLVEIFWDMLPFLFKAPVNMKKTNSCRPGSNNQTAKENDPLTVIMQSSQTPLQCQTTNDSDSQLHFALQLVHLAYTKCIYWQPSQIELNSLLLQVCSFHAPASRTHGHEGFKNAC